ncbi:alpha/beta fold hydrolase [Dongia sp.]|uniref:alpha/beta fold hydrolase n=1 Tax=Dongia sp. TaxID=1977262 RepID=UPI0035B48552
MPLIALDGLSLWYRYVAGQQPSKTPALLIQGLGMQATDWPEEIIATLVAERPVLVFDNRDSGLSQLFGRGSIETLTEKDFPGAEALTGPLAYSLSDMAEDAWRLLDALGISRIHLVGFSMGGMIAQVMAAVRPGRVASLTGLMTSAGQAWIESTPAADTMMRRSILLEGSQKQLADFMLAAEDIYAGPTLLPPEEARRRAIRQALARGHHPAGIWRQARAMRAAGERRSLLAAIVAPTLMLHGAADPVIAPAQAAAIKDILPAATFVELWATGHILTEANAAAIAAKVREFWRETGGT